MNNRVHPAFDPILKALGGDYDTTDRGEIGIAVNQEFDPWDSDLMHDLCGKRMGPAVQGLLLALKQIEMTKNSFGADDKATVEFLMPMLYKLREAVIEEWRDEK